MIVVDYYSSSTYIWVPGFLIANCQLVCYYSACSEEVPFSVPSHLQDQNCIFERLQTTGGGATLSGESTLLEDVAINSAEANKLLS